VLTLVGAVVTVAALTVVLASLRFFGGRSVRQSVVKRGDNGVKKALRGLYRSSVKYISLDHFPGFVERWGAVIEDYAAGRHWFPCVEQGFALITATAAGLAAAAGDDGGWCKPLQTAELVASVVFLAALFFSRPLAVKADWALAMANAGLQCVSALFGLAGRDLSEACLVLSCAVTALYYAAYLVWSAAGNGETLKLLRIARRALRSGSRRRHRQQSTPPESREERRSRVVVLSRAALEQLLFDVSGGDAARAEDQRTERLRRILGVICQS
jgi:hypothetical protein